MNRKLLALSAEVIMVMVLLLPSYVVCPIGEAHDTAIGEPLVRKFPGQEGTIKAAWIYVGPIGDYGWTHAHDRGREIVDQLFDWLETHYRESVLPGECLSVIDGLVDEGYTVIFTTSYDFLEATLEAGEKYPDVLFFHCSGDKRRANVATYFAEFYQLYYLNGLMAGALTKTGKAGYVAAKPIPEVIRHINAFAIGFAETAKQRGFEEPKVYVRWIFEWYDPERAREAATALIGEGCDVLAFTEDSPTVVEVCQTHYDDTGEVIYVFGHYSPMYDYGPDVIVSGQLVRWEVIYADILEKVKDGTYTASNLATVDYWWMLNESAVELGCDFGMPINPKFEDDLRAVSVEDTKTGQGTMSAYDLVMLRLEQMRSEKPHVSKVVGGELVWTKPDITFDPFMGPLRDQEGNLRVPEGDRLGHDDLWTMMWFVEWVVGEIPGEQPGGGLPTEYLIIGIGVGIVIAVVAIFWFLKLRRK